MRGFKMGWAAMAIVAVVGWALAADAPTPAPKPAPTQEEMMAAMQKAAAPGPEHAVLKNFEGKWTTKVNMMMDPAHPEKSEGTSEGTLELGGRFVHVVHHGTMMGQPFEGHMLLGYDNLAKKYTSAWVDNSGTAIITYQGSYNAAKKALTMSARFTDPMSGQQMQTKGITTFQGPDAMTYDEFGKGPDGKPMQFLHIEFKRS
jgi:Protein of unknown function (DUF1579)